MTISNALSYIKYDPFHCIDMNLVLFYSVIQSGVLGYYVLKIYIKERGCKFTTLYNPFVCDKAVISFAEANFMRRVELNYQLGYMIFFLCFVPKEQDLPQQWPINAIESFFRSTSVIIERFVLFLDDCRMLNIRGHLLPCERRQG